MGCSDADTDAIGQFVFDFSVADVQYVVTTRLTQSDLSSPIDSLAHRIIHLNCLPLHVFPSLRRQLVVFVADQHRSGEAGKWRRAHQLSQQKHQVLAEQLAAKYSSQVRAFAPLRTSTEQELRADMFNQVIHSHAADDLVKIVQRSNQLVAETVDSCRQQLQQLLARHQQLLAEAAQLYSDERVNQLTAEQQDDMQLAECRSNSRIEAIKEEQRSLFWQWVLRAHESLQTNTPLPPRPPPPSSCPPSSQASVGGVSGDGTGGRLQESFTVHLGTQLKHTYNLQLLAVDVVDMLQYASGCQDDNVVDAQLMHTLVALYSRQSSGSGLSALLLLSGRRRGHRCRQPQQQQQPEHHNNNNNKQQQQMLDSKPNQLGSVRFINHRCVELHFANTSLPTPPTSRLEDQATRVSATNTCHVRVTRHSTLCGVHVLLHVSHPFDNSPSDSDDNLDGEELLDDGPVEDQEEDEQLLAARLAAVRRAVQLARSCRLTQLIIPLLLAQRLGSHMTLAWCVRRAELVLKCVKACLLDTQALTATTSGVYGAGGGAGGGGGDSTGDGVAGGGSSPSTLVFLVPAQADQQLFQLLAEQLTSVFRQASALVLRSG